LLARNAKSFQNLVGKIEFFFLDTEQVGNSVHPVSVAGAESDGENLTLIESDLSKLIDIFVRDLPRRQGKFFGKSQHGFLLLFQVGLPPVGDDLGNFLNRHLAIDTEKLSVTDASEPAPAERCDLGRDELFLAPP
jgi:hypothetical protein